MNENDWLDLKSTKYRTILDLRGRMDGDILLLGHYHYDRAMPPVPEQSSHNRLVLGFLISGLQRYRVDGRDLVLHGGQGIRFLPGSRYSSVDMPEQKGELYWLAIHVSHGGKVKLPCFDKEAAQSWSKQALDKKRALRFPISDRIKHCLRRLMTLEDEKNDPMCRTRMSLEFGGMLADLYDLLGLSLGDHTTPEILKSLKYMEQHLYDPDLNIEQLARAAGLSIGRYHHRFRMEMGLPPADYLRYRRIIEAQRILSSEKPPSVTELAIKLGFSSSQYFATVFKRYTRMSPSEWRRASWEDGSVGGGEIEGF